MTLRRSRSRTRARGGCWSTAVLAREHARARRCRPSRCGDHDPGHGAQRGCSAADLAGWFRSKGKTSARRRCRSTSSPATTSARARDEGVAGDLAFAQSIVETGYFTFSTRVPGVVQQLLRPRRGRRRHRRRRVPDRRSSASGPRSSTSGPTPIPTVTTAKLAHPVVDPRFSLRRRRRARRPTWEQFGNGIWATDPGYAAKVLGIYQQILDVRRHAAGHRPGPRSATSACRWSTQAYADILGRHADRRRAGRGRSRPSTPAARTPARPASPRW